MLGLPNSNFLKNISNKNIEYIKNKINTIPLITTNFTEKTITIKKTKFNIEGLLCKGGSKQIFLLKNNKKDSSIVYRCPLIKFDNDSLIINNFIENFIHLFLSDMNKNKILKIYQLGYNPDYNFLCSFIDKMDGTLYGYLKKDDLDFKFKFKTLLKELYEIALLLEELQDKFKFVHNDLKCDNIFYKNDKFYLGDFDNISLEIKHYKINWQEFNQKKDLFILTQSLFFSFNDDSWKKYFFKYFPIIDNIKNQKEFHQLYNYKNINDIYIPSNYKKIIENILSN
jgi:hypothetical protein